MNDSYTTLTVTIGVSALALLRGLYVLQTSRPAHGMSFAMFAVGIADYNACPLSDLLGTCPGGQFYVPLA